LVYLQQAGGKAAAKERSDWPSDVQQGGAAADQGRQAAGPSEERAAERSAAASLRRPQKQKRSLQAATF